MYTRDDDRMFELDRRNLETIHRVSVSNLTPPMGPECLCPTDNCPVHGECTCPEASCKQHNGWVARRCEECYELTSSESDDLCTRCAARRPAATGRQED